MAGNWNSVVKIFKIFENLLGEFGLELGHLGFIIRNYWLWRWVSGAWRRSMRFCFAFGTAPVGYAPHVRFAVLLCIWDCSSSSLTRSVTHLWSGLAGNQKKERAIVQCRFGRNLILIISIVLRNPNYQYI